MGEYKERERFIPFQKTEIISRIRKTGVVGPENEDRFQLFCRMLESIYHFEFHKELEILKNSYFPLNPDRDTRMMQPCSEEECKASEREFLGRFKSVLKKANYTRITESDIAYAIEKESLFKINLFVDFNDFESSLIFGRGSHREQETVRKWFFQKSVIEMNVYDRVALIIKFKDEDYFQRKKRKDLKFIPGSMIVKLFKNIPKADMEMLFPNTQVRMKLKDKLILAGGAIGGGAAVLLKAGAGLLAMMTVLWFLVHSLVESGGSFPALKAAQISGMVGGVSAIAAIAAFLVKQWNGYKNRKIRFMKTLGDNLYFKNLDNNAGVFHHVIDDAEEEECKEAMLAYFFLLRSPHGLTAAALDDAIEEWFENQLQTRLDFEISDAVSKLEALSLCQVTEKTETEKPVYQAVPLEDACRRLDRTWDNYFKA